jgi:tetratricopeptide (TPR) repeat protein
MRAGIRTIVAALLVAGLGLPATAPAAEDGGVESPFAHGAGNRALAMGGAFTAVADDASAPVWNPGGLAHLDRRGVTGSQASLLGLDANEQHFALGWPSWRWGAAAFTARRIGVGEIDGRDDRNVPLGTFDHQDLELAVTYARVVGDAWGLGGSVKLRRQEIAEFSANGFGLDLGVHVRPFVAAGSEASWAGRCALGFAVRNAVAPSIKLDREAVTEPTTVTAGAAWTQPLPAGMSVLAALDVEKTRSVDPDLHAGLELTPHPLLALRAGWNGNELTAGAGVRYSLFSFDYAFENLELDPVHRFGFSIAFGGTVHEQRLAAQREEEEQFRIRLAEAFERRQEERQEDLAERAAELLDEGRPEAALEVVATLRALAPDDPRAADLEARALLAQAGRREEAEKFAEAAILYGRVLALRPADSLAADGLLRCRTESNLRAERTSRIRELFAGALDAFTAGDLLGARSRLNDILTLAPDDAEARTMLDRTERAIDARVRSLLADAGRSIDRELLDEAAERLEQARGLDPGADGLLALETRLKNAERDLQERARRQQTEAERTRLAQGEPPTPKAPALTRKERREIADLYRRGLEALEDERSEDALRYWELVWLKDPDYENVADFLKREYLLRGLEEFSGGRLDEAIRLWEKAYTVDPEDEKTQGYLARAREQRTRTREILGE